MRTTVSVGIEIICILRRYSKKRVNPAGVNRLFYGGAGGSEDNPDYYGTNEFAVINVGMTASREMTVSETSSMPLSASFHCESRRRDIVYAGGH